MILGFGIWEILEPIERGEQNVNPFVLAGTRLPVKTEMIYCLRGTETIIIIMIIKEKDTRIYPPPFILIFHLLLFLPPKRHQSYPYIVLKTFFHHQTDVESFCIYHQQKSMM